VDFADEYADEENPRVDFARRLLITELDTLNVHQSKIMYCIGKPAKSPGKIKVALHKPP